MKPLTIALLLLIALAIWLATRGEVRSLPRGEPTKESSAGPQKANLRSENPTESGRTPPPVDMDHAPDLRGSVRSESNLPLADVRVALVHGSWRDRDPDNDDGTLLAETWTDTEGSFAFQGIEPNEHAPQRPLFMIAEARGYLEARQAVALGRDTRFTLIPRAASVIVRGRVLGEGGRFLPRFEHSDLARVEDERGVRVESSWKAHQQQEPGFQLVLNHGGSASFVFTVRAPGYSSLSKELTPSGGHVEAGDIILPLSRSVFGWVVDADDETPVGNGNAAGAAPLIGARLLRRAAGCRGRAQGGCRDASLCDQRRHEGVQPSRPGDRHDTSYRPLIREFPRSIAGLGRPP